MDIRSDQNRGTTTANRPPLLVALYYGSMVFTAVVVVQFYLAGAGIFRLTGPVKDAASLDPHRILGNILAVLALLLLILTLVARPGRRMVGTAVALFVLTGVEGLIAGTGDSLPYLAAFHLVVAAAILGAGLSLTLLARRSLASHTGRAGGPVSGSASGSGL